MHCRPSRALDYLPSLALLHTTVSHNGVCSNKHILPWLVVNLAIHPALPLAPFEAPISLSSSHTHNPHSHALVGTVGLTSNTALSRSLTTFSWLFLPDSLISLIFCSASLLASSSAFLFPCECYRREVSSAKGTWVLTCLCSGRCREERREMRWAGWFFWMDGGFV